jgi:hypothetical protein
MALPALHSEGTSKNSKQSKEASRQAASLWLMETAHMSLFGSGAVAKKPNQQGWQGCSCMVPIFMWHFSFLV